LTLEKRKELRGGGRTTGSEPQPKSSSVQARFSNLLKGKDPALRIEELSPKKRGRRL